MLTLSEKSAESVLYLEVIKVSGARGLSVHLT